MVVLMYVHWPHCYMGHSQHICIGSNCLYRRDFHMVAGTKLDFLVMFYDKPVHLLVKELYLVQKFWVTDLYLKFALSYLLGLLILQIFFSNDLLK